jgi:hypothetical protein
MPIICPVCRNPTGTFQEPLQTHPGIQIVKDVPLYGYSYKGSKDYLPPRCLKCYDKVMERRKNA